MKDIITSFTIFLLACGWIHFMDFQLPSEVMICVKTTIYAHLALGAVYVIRFAMAIPKTKKVKKAITKPVSRDEVDHHLSLVVD